MKATNAISLETAQDWAAKYRQDPNNTVKAFLIPRADFLQILDDSEAVDIRAYLGIDETGEQKLMLVGTDSQEKDLINEFKGQLIYDMTKPCPTCCDPKSPLFNLP